MRVCLLYVLRSYSYSIISANEENESGLPLIVLCDNKKHLTNSLGIWFLAKFAAASSSFYSSSSYFFSRSGENNKNQGVKN